jgi:hypothetical protein
MPLAPRRPWPFLAHSFLPCLPGAFVGSLAPPSPCIPGLFGSPSPTASLWPYLVPFRPVTLDGSPRPSSSPRPALHGPQRPSPALLRPSPGPSRHSTALPLSPSRPFAALDDPLTVPRTVPALTRKPTENKPNMQYATQLPRILRVLAEAAVKNTGHTPAARASGPPVP